MKRFITAFSIVFAREFRETLRSKPFKVISVFLAVILVLLAAAGFFLAADISGSENTFGSADYTDGGAAAENTVTYFHSMAVDDRTGLGLTERLRQELPAYRLEEMPLDETRIEHLVSDGEYDACAIILAPDEFEYYEEASLYGDSYMSQSFCDALETIGRMDAMAALGIDEAQARGVLDGHSIAYTVYGVEAEGSGSQDIGMFVYNYIVIILMFLVIGLYGQMVATRVATEKSSRTMEVLATSVSPTELLCGKVAGVGAAGLIQIIVFVCLAAGIVRGVLAGSPVLALVAEQLLSISAGDLACLVIYFLLGFALYAFIFGALGSMVSQIEDLSGVASMPMYLFMVGYFVSLTGTVGTEPGIMLRLASFVPFWSPVAMFARMSAENVPVWQLALSIGLLALTTVLTAWLSARIYRSGMLRYGKPPKLREIINAAREGR